MSTTSDLSETGVNYQKGSTKLIMNFAHTVKNYKYRWQMWMKRKRHYLMDDDDDDNDAKW